MKRPAQSHQETGTEYKDLGLQCVEPAKKGTRGPHPSYRNASMVHRAVHPRPLSQCLF